MHRRDYVLLASGVALPTVLAGCASEEGDPPADGGGGEPTEEPTNSPTPTTQPQSAFGPETFSGSGTATTDEFELIDAPLTAEYSHEGEGNFQTKLVALEGESYEDVYLTNAIGDTEGSKVANVTTSGPFALDVNSDGDWEITLEQVMNPNAESLPIDASGSGPSYLGPYQFDGATQFTATHSGERNFIVQSVPLDTLGFGDIIFNKIGSFDGSTTARPGGFAYLNVEADGDWTLTTE